MERYLPTGNEMISLPKLNEQTAAIEDLTFLSMQQRGMEAAGICVNDNQGNFSYVTDEGLVTEVFDEMKLEKLQGHAGIGHILIKRKQ